MTKNGRPLPALLTVAGAIFLGASAAGAASSIITNGNFETDAVDSTTITGWNVVNSRVNLGVTSIGGCVSQDTSDYTTLRDWAAEALDDGYSGPDATARADDHPESAMDPSEYEWETKIVDGSGLEYDGTSLARSGKVVQIRSEMNSNETEAEGYVVHGPALYSDAFTAPAGRQIRLDWAASGEDDDYHVLGYLLNVDTCAQTEVLDDTGEYRTWNTVSLEIPTAGTYRFVFVGGTYDQSWGGAAGALLWVDNIIQTSAFTGAGVDLSLGVNIGDPVAGASAQISGSGLKPNSDYRVELRSTPRVIETGTADAAGLFVDVITLPADIEPGKHTLTLYGIAPDDVELTSVAYVTVDKDGKVGYLSYEVAESAAVTGFGSTLTLSLLGAVLIGLGIATSRRRTPAEA